MGSHVVLFCSTTGEHHLHRRDWGQTNSWETRKRSRLYPWVSNGPALGICLLLTEAENPGWLMGTAAMGGRQVFPLAAAENLGS